jgi:hypothetical protein
MDGSDRSGRPGEVADRQALDTYRKRLADVDDEIDEAARNNDFERVARLEAERQAVLDEVGRVSDVHGRARQFANHPAERARKAVAGRVRDAIRKLEPLLPDLAAHLHRTIVTGTYCRYRGDDGVSWDVGAS